MPATAAELQIDERGELARAVARAAVVRTEHGARDARQPAVPSAKRLATALDERTLRPRPVREERVCQRR